MPFLSLRLASFRNLEDATLPIAADRVFLVGENGQGKTNFLEALYYLSYGSSFRGSVDAEAPRRGSEGFLLEAATRTDLAEDSLPPEEIRVAWTGKAKDIRREGKPLKDRKELVERNPAVVFCHEDFSFAAGEPERRRFFFDQTAGLVSAAYIDALRDYKRILKQRNAALKEGRLSILDLLDEQLAGRGLELMEARGRVAADFDGRIALLYERVSLLGVEVRLRYRPSWPADADREAVVERLAARRSDELALGTSLSGPHRDRYLFLAEGRDFTATASTGQQRLLSLALRTAQADYFTSQTGRRPVLLLDDVLLELDPGKRKRFLESLPEASQAFFTFLPGEPWEGYRGPETIVYRVEHGRFED